jgi:hypothetical protein
MVVFDYLVVLVEVVFMQLGDLPLNYGLFLVDLSQVVLQKLVDIKVLISSALCAAWRPFP